MRGLRTTAVVPSLLALFLAAGLLASAPGQAPPPAQGQRPVVPQAVRDRIARAGSARVIVELRLDGRRGRAGGTAGQCASDSGAAPEHHRRSRARARAAGARHGARDPPLSDGAVRRARGDQPECAQCARVVPRRRPRGARRADAAVARGERAAHRGRPGVAGRLRRQRDGRSRSSTPAWTPRIRFSPARSSTRRASRARRPAPASRSARTAHTTQIGAGAAAPCLLSDCLHGTHVAGIAAGNGDAAGQPFSGVAKGASLVAVQVFSEVIDSDLVRRHGAVPRRLRVRHHRRPRVRLRPQGRRPERRVGQHEPRRRIVRRAVRHRAASSRPSTTCARSASPRSSPRATTFEVTNLASPACISTRGERRLDDEGRRGRLVLERRAVPLAASRRATASPRRCRAAATRR